MDRMSARPRQPRRIDHLVLPVTGLPVARARLTDLGFTVAADACHLFGTENCCVFLSDGSYLEPLGIANREDCEAAARGGNVFVARDQAFRFRRGPDGLSAIAMASDDAFADGQRYAATGLSAGPVLEFSRNLMTPDGATATGRFRLAFAADPRAPDFFCFSCERVVPLPGDRTALERHANGVAALAEVVLFEPNPTDFQYLLQEAAAEREVQAHSFGMSVETPRGRISVLNEAGMVGFFGFVPPMSDRGLKGVAVVFRTTCLNACRALFAERGVEFHERDGRLIVPPRPARAYSLFSETDMQANSTVIAGEGAAKVTFAQDARLSLIAGPCQMESRDHAYMIAGTLTELCVRLGIGLVYKSSFDKANRTSLSGKRGIGLDRAMEVFADLKKDFGFPVLTDIHTEEQCAVVAKTVDILQIPAFLSRQTDLLVAAAKTGRIINVKKGQFLAPWDMKNVLAKFTESGNPNVLLCERGASFGYNTLVSDMRSLPIMAALGAPVVFDATHSVQQPGGQGGSSGGQREFVETLARAAVAVGVAGLFIETHEDPDNAPSDGPNMVHLKDMPRLLEKLVALDAVAKA